MPSSWRQGNHAQCFYNESDGTRKKLVEMNMHTEFDRRGLDKSALNVMLFLQECVLPVATQTNALVLMHGTECVLSSAFSEICAAEVEKMGGKLPFTPLCIFGALALETASTTPGTVSYSLRHQSKRWKEAGTKLHDCQEKECGMQVVDHNNNDLPSGCTHYIIVDAVTKGKHDLGPRDLFKNAFTQRLAAELPNLAIATMRAPEIGLGQLKLYEDYVGRQLPLLVLDARQRPAGKPDYPADFATAAAELAELQRGLQEVGKCNRQLTSLLAYMRGVLERVHHKKKDGRSELKKQPSTHSFQAIDIDGDGELSLEELQHYADMMKEPESVKKKGAVCSWIWQVRKRMENEQHVRGEDDESVKQAQAMEAVSVLEKAYFEADAQRQKFPADRYRKCAEKITDLANTTAALDPYMAELSADFCHREARYRNELLLERFPHELELHQEFDKVKHWKPFMQVLRLRESCSNADVAGLKQKLAEIITEWADEQDEKYINALETTFRRDEFMATYNLFLSPCLHSCNITDRRKISMKISEVAKIDRLPVENSHEAMVILSSAWDHVDIFMGMAKRMKSYAKVLYGLLLLAGMGTVLTVTITLLGQDSACDIACQSYNDVDTAALCKAEFCEPKPGYISEVITDEQSRFIVLGLSILASLLASTVSYLNPAQRWQQLRGAALSLESEIWKFRTRCGSYSIAGKMGIHSVSRESERRLMDFQSVLVQQVSKSAGLLDTSLHAQFELFGEPSRKRVTKFKHGQYDGAGTHGTFGASNRGIKGNVDDHHSPLHAPDYLKYRIELIVNFYRGRLPRYYFSRTVSQYLLLFGTFAAMVLAFLDISAWAAVPTALTTALTAWTEFSGTDKKLNR
jgi:hypothetical protein